MIRVTLPIKTVSESNMRQGWHKRAKRAKDQRTVVRLRLWSEVWHIRAGLCVRNEQMPWVVTLTRISPRALDDDNLRGALKGVRDGISDALGIKDNDPRVEWRYAQEKAKPAKLSANRYGVVIEIEAATDASELASSRSAG